MTSRERWVLYPLLFLTLGIVMRDKFFQRDTPIRARHILCRHLDVVDSNGQPQVQIEGIDDVGGVLKLYGAEGRPLVAMGPDETRKSGIIETYGAGGKPQVQLWSHQYGGMVTTAGAGTDVRLILGHYGPDYGYGQNFGVFAESRKLGRRMLLTFPREFRAGPVPTAKEEDPPDTPEQHEAEASKASED